MNTINVNGQTYYAVDQQQHHQYYKLKEKYDWLQYLIQSTVEEAQSLYDNMREEQLVVGTVEAEGFLRCAKTLANGAKNIDESDL